ncbi:Resolvase domain protein [Segniliparus rotundus DSM 44985]|uniref:Resolvase domain protein n=1 Tax=Segniliparus rotundus (strain ATCC BAA-972 / CDC 1076 / CIP 108378 / DSM 44985 / JCM 13578) TaxID=640132 RepID=D6Z8Y5_SEGRD|nr:recombinase family protein [Segniliparus rotundus]ADG98415.1 Resolvase domain protein [Segniliparus rotundus DSM 44985]
MPIRAESTKRAGSYLRISYDQEGLELGVDRQREDNSKKAAEKGWAVAREYVDNDLSAYSGVARPGFEQMVEDIRDGVIDAIVVWNFDRLIRIPSELETLSKVCAAAGVRQVATMTADIDLGNDDGLFMARIFAAWAAKESGRKSARIKRKWEQNAKAGLPHGPSRPFGYEQDKITVRESEAQVIRELASRFVAGESVRGLANWLNETGMPTATGKAQWTISTVRRILLSPRIAGLREHCGEIVGDAMWEPIIGLAEREQVLAKFAARAVSGRRAPRTHLLSGLLRCGKCGYTLRSSSRTPHDISNRRRRYICVLFPARDSCGKLTVVAEPVEELITRAVLDLLDSPELAKKMAGKESEDGETAALSEALTMDQLQLEELAQLYSQRTITIREWIAARDPIQARIRDAERRLAQATQTTALTGFAGRGEELRGQWEELSLDRRCAVVKSVLDHAVIAPGVRGARTLDIGRVQPVWRV